MATERQKVCKKEILFANVDGNEMPAGVKFKFTDGTVLQVNNDELSEYVREYAIAHGVSSRVGDGYAGVKGDVGEAIENAQSLIEVLRSGAWAGERESAGPRPSLVAEAVVAAKRKAGNTFDEEATRQKYLGKDATALRKNALENPQVKAEFERLRAEAAAERAKEAAAKAASTAAEAAKTDDL